MDRIGYLLLIIPGLPLLGCLIIGLLGPRFSRPSSLWPALLTGAALAGSFFASAALLSEVRFEQAAQAQRILEDRGAEAHASFERVYELWNWATVPDAHPGIGPDPQPLDLDLTVSLRADTLTVTMLCMVTFIATLVAVFGAGYMRGDRSYWRFFCYVCLFVFSMTMLVSVSNFMLLFVFWEAVGVCSYLLIGFWYQKPEAAAAGTKAFLVNRVGDFGFALGVFLIWTTFGTLNFHDTATVAQASPAATETGAEAAGDTQPEAAGDTDAEAAGDTQPEAAGDTQPEAAAAVPRYVDIDGLAGDEPEHSVVPGVLGKTRAQQPYPGGTIAIAICLLLLVGACGKSAQFPLHVWLPDAMEGPTPVSALIHAATMVTAGVYMIARCTPLFMAAPEAQLTVAVVGTITALMAGIIAITQHDLKRVLAYSTISQLGYMFLGLGVGTFAGITAAMFHLFTHAFFKALLFLGSGSVMHAMGHVIDMRKFSGLRRLMPITHATFLIGCLALAGLFPLAGFWSKDGLVAAVHDRAHAAHAAHGEAGGHALRVPADESSGVAGLLAGTTPVAFLAADTDHETAHPSDPYGRVYGWLYWIAMFTAFLTAFYTFRAYLRTFCGDLVVPPEAGDHAHESPASMTGPLVVLAVCSCLAGLFFDRTYTFTPTHLFTEFLGSTPSLAGVAVEATRTAPKFHLDIAGTSTVIAIFGMGLACYLYLGDRTAVRWLTSVMQLDWPTRIFDVESVSKMRHSEVVQVIYRDAQRLRLGWLASLIGQALILVLWLLAAPLALFRFISPYRLSEGKFYLDEIYQRFLVAPLRWLARLAYAADRWLVDGLVNLVGATPPALGNVMRSLQMGLVQFYALVMVLGIAILIFARMFAS